MKLDNTYNGNSENEWGVPNFCPKRFTGEDDSSLKLHLETISTEFKRPDSQRSILKICYAMERLYPERRQEILSGMKLAELKEKYPILFEA